MRKRKSDPTVKEAYFQNEVAANKEMTKVAVFMALVMAALFVPYLLKVFPLRNYVGVYIIFPVDILLLLSPLVWSRTRFIEKRQYKSFLISLVLLVVSALNIVIPKHGILAWAFVILLCNHYYSRSLTTRTYFAVLCCMLLCLYLGMFFGEYDNNLLGSGTAVEGEIVQAETPEERYWYLHQRLLDGDNRYLKVFLFYYLARAAIITATYFVSGGLNIRTYNLLKREVGLKTEQKKIATELDVASSIQTSALPKEFISSPYLSFYGSMHPAKEIGGDFFNYRLRGEDLYFVIGDVSGKGIPAAMFMMKANTYFETGVNAFSSPKDIVLAMNEGLFENNDSMMFITCIVGKLNRLNGELILANAGHNRPLIERRGRYEYLPLNPGFLLGTVENPPIQEEKAKLLEGEHLVLYTDGVTECKNARGELYGEETFCRFLNGLKESDPQALNDLLYAELMGYKGEAEQSDDITIFAFYYRGAPLVLENSPKSTEAMQDFVQEKLEKHGASVKAQRDLAVSIDEIGSNLFSYSKAKRVEVRFEYDEATKKATIVILDDGEAFDPLAKADPNTQLPLEERPIGGLGIYLVKKLVDEVSYRREDGKNILTILKTIR